MIKTWLITASAPICGTDTYYRAYSKENPELLRDWIDICSEIIEELWDSYSWCLHLEDNEYDSPDEEAEVYDQAWEDWRSDCEITVNEATEEDLLDVAPGGDLENIDIVHDERE